MALMPKRVKHRKSQRRRIKGDAHRGNTVVFGEWGLQSLEADDLEASILAWEDRAEKAGRSDSVYFESSFAAALLARKGQATYSWTTFGENCPNCNALAGRTVRQGSPFVRRGERLPTMDVEKTVFYPPLHRGCDCMIV